MQQATIGQIRFQATRTSPGRGTDTGIEGPATDPEPADGNVMRLILSVLGNVVGGTLLLSGMLVLPHLIARILS